MQSNSIHVYNTKEFLVFVVAENEKVIPYSISSVVAGAVNGHYMNTVC